MRRFVTSGILIAAAVVATVAGGVGNGRFALAEPAVTCPYGDVTVVAARGSGESTDLDGGGYGSVLDRAGRYGAAVYRELSVTVASSGVVVGLAPIDYPAIGVLSVAADFVMKLVSPSHPVDLDGYVASVQEGVEMSIDMLETIAATPGCGPDHPVVLVGYSQGAHVIQLVLENIVGSELSGMPAAVGLFASPMFTWSDPSVRGSFPPESTGVASLFVGDFNTAAVPMHFGSVTRTWCHAGDVVCDAVVSNLATTHVHTGSGYGVTADGNAAGPGTALSDVVNTVEWALRQRGVLPDSAPPGTVTGFPWVAERGTAVDGNDLSASLWVSAANIVGSDQPITQYAWDLDNDGDYELFGEHPILETSFERTDFGGASDTEVVFGLLPTGPIVDQRYEVCWDLKLHADCGTRFDTFSDDGGSVFAADIEWLAANGITRGCNPPANDRFCPDSAVTRGQMAAFLHRALDGIVEPTGDPIDFTDDVDSTFVADIAWLSATGITTGCTATEFCPDEPVTRGQMAAFLVRALGYTDDGGGDLFVDDDDSIFEADIDKLATAGVTRGCNPPVNDEFCPTSNVTRGQMAAFLHRALG